MNDWLYTTGFSLMVRSWPGALTLGALLVRIAREFDPDEDSQDRAWDMAHAMIESHKEEG